MIDKDCTYVGDHELIHDEAQAGVVHAAFAEIIGAEQWPGRWAGPEVDELLADREAVEVIRRTAEAEGWDDAPVPPVPEIPAWLK